MRYTTVICKAANPAFGFQFLVIHVVFVGSILHLYSSTQIESMYLVRYPHWNLKCYCFNFRQSPTNFRLKKIFKAVKHIPSTLDPLGPPPDKVGSSFDAQCEPSMTISSFISQVTGKMYIVHSLGSASHPRNWTPSPPAVWKLVCGWQMLHFEQAH